MLAEPLLGPEVESLVRHALASRQEHYLERARAALLGTTHITAATSSGSARDSTAATGDSGGGSQQGGLHTAEAWQSVTAGGPVVLDTEYYERLANGALQVRARAAYKHVLPLVKRSSRHA